MNSKMMMRAMMVLGAVATIMTSGSEAAFADPPKSLEGQDGRMYDINPQELPGGKWHEVSVGGKVVGKIMPLGSGADAEVPRAKSGNEDEDDDPGSASAREWQVMHAILAGVADQYFHMDQTVVVTFKSNGKTYHTECKYVPCRRLEVYDVAARGARYASIGIKADGSFEENDDRSGGLSDDQLKDIVKSWKAAGGAKSSGEKGDAFKATLVPNILFEHWDNSRHDWHIDSTFTPMTAAMNACFKKLMADEPKARGTMGVHLAIDENGKVIGIGYGEHDDIPPTFKTCAVPKLKALVFNPPGSKEWVEFKILITDTTPEK